MGAGKVIGNILIILTVAFTVYLSFVMIKRIKSVVLKDSYVEIFRYELAACAVFILLALDIRFGFFTKLHSAAWYSVLLNGLGWILRIVVILLAAVLLFFIGKVIAGSFIHAANAPKNAIVLGLALENGKPTGDLVSRLDTAEQYLQKNPDAILILTGGNPDESGKTEADVMHDILAEPGVAENRMILEDQAETTRDNFRNVAKIIDPGEPVALISSNYHMDRAARTAKSAGFSNVRHLPAPSSFINYGANIMYEVILELNELTIKH